MTAFEVLRPPTTHDVMKIASRLKRGAHGGAGEHPAGRPELGVGAHRTARPDPSAHHHFSPPGARRVHPGSSACPIAAHTRSDSQSDTREPSGVGLASSSAPGVAPARSSAEQLWNKHKAQVDGLNAKLAKLKQKLS